MKNQVNTENTKSNMERLFANETWFPAYSDFMKLMAVLAEKEKLDSNTKTSGATR